VRDAPHIGARTESLTLSVFDAIAEARERGRPLVVAQLGQSLDGRIATVTGDSFYINGKPGLCFLHRLRAAVDAVVVGAGTAAADNPQLTVRHCTGRNPSRVLIDRRRRVGSDVRMLAHLPGDGPEVQRIVFGQQRPGDRDVSCIECAPDTDVGPQMVLEELHARQLSIILIEGGATTVSRFLAAGALDRLCLLIAPVIIGSGQLGTQLPVIDSLRDAHRLRGQWHLLDGGEAVFDGQIG